MTLPNEQSEIVVERDVAPCPFCGAVMARPYPDLIEHPWRGECPLGTIKFYTSAIDDWNTRAATPTTPVAQANGDREAIARIIYPEIFKPETPQDNRVYRNMGYHEARADALAKADAILAALPVTPALGREEVGQIVAIAIDKSITETRTETQVELVDEAADKILALQSQPTQGADKDADDEARRDAWSDFESDHLTDGNDGYREASVYRACREAFETAWAGGRGPAIAAASAALYLGADKALVEAAITHQYTLKWISGARPPVHPEPMNGSQLFASFDQAIACMKRQADDAVFVSLTERQVTETDVSDRARAALSHAKDAG